MTLTVRALNEAGLMAFRAYLDGLVQAGGEKPPVELLEDSGHTESLAVIVTVDTARSFDNKLEFGRYLAGVLDPVRKDPAMDRHVGLWSWLALSFFEQICPGGADGSRRVSAQHRYILARDYKHHYRHLVRTPCITFAIHGENARLVLSGALDVHGEASEQLLSREHILTNTALFAAMDRLYVRRASEGEYRVKSGARSKGVGGTMRRLGKIVKQFDLTYDLRAMNTERILGLLPREFDRFKKEA